MRRVADRRGEVALPSSEVAGSASETIRATLGLALLFLLLLSGCGKPSEAASGNILRVSQRNEPADLDPATASLPDEFFIIRAVGEGLLVPDPKGGKPIPAAAERYELSPDGLTYTFYLRREARWSNGEAVTAADFVASYERLLAPSTASPKAHLFDAVRQAREYNLGQVPFAAVGIRALDAHTLVITLARPTPRFSHYVASGPWIPVNPRVVARYGRTWTQPEHHVGNGPFTLAEWRPQQRIVVTKNPRYVDAAGVALAGIHFIRLDGKDNEERAYRAGQVDVTMAVPESKLDLYAREHPGELRQQPLAETRFLTFNPARRPLDDARVRRALSLAIDRQRIVDLVLRGGQVPAHRFVSPALHGGTDAPARHDHDPAAARALMAEAGYPDGRGFPQLELAGWASNPALETIQQMWRHELGIEIALVTQEAKVHLDALVTGRYDIGFATNLLDVADSVAALADFASDAPNNFPHWRSPEYDRLLDAAAHDRDPLAAERAWLEAERLLLDAAVVAPLYFNTQNWLMSPRVQGWQQDALWNRRYNEVRLRP